MTSQVHPCASRIQTLRQGSIAGARSSADNSSHSCAIRALEAELGDSSTSLAWVALFWEGLGLRVRWYGMVLLLARRRM